MAGGGGGGEAGLGVAGLLGLAGLAEEPMLTLLSVREGGREGWGGRNLEDEPADGALAAGGAVGLGALTAGWEAELDAVEYGP